VSFFRRIFGRQEASQAASRSISKEDAFAAYIIREHRSGRSLEDILDDAYLKNRTTEEQRLRLLESPEVIRSVGEDTAAMAAERVRSS
jgi:hypothetical protein